VADIERTIAPLCAADPELDVTVEVAYEAPYSFIPADAPIVREVQKACVEVTGKEMPVLASPATSDSRWLVLYAKIPTCKFSFTTVGSGPNERLHVDRFYDMVRVYVTVTMNTLYSLHALPELERQA
jgi:acetylornithine deacetylase/succinyl-diaminopimelate desuccinylase-like protein